MDIVKKMWAAYCEAAGGVTYDGKPLPTWEELGEDRQKCWMAAGKETTDEIERLREALDCYTCDCKEDVCKERYLNCGQAARYALEGKND